MTAPNSSPLLTGGNEQDLFGNLTLKLTGYWEVAAIWIRINWFELLVALFIAMFIYLFLGWLRGKANGIARRSPDRFAFSAIAARTLGRTGRFFRTMVALELVNALTNAPRMIAHIFHLAFTIAVAVQAAIWAREIILGLIEKRASEQGDENETLANALVLIRLLISFAIFAIAAIVILDNLGVDVTGLIAGLGVGGIAIGLAAQGIFSDLFAAIAIIFDKPFQKGDVVRFGTNTATVETIGMKSTRLRSITGEMLVISNAKLLESEITNFTRTDYRRTIYQIGIVYQTKPEMARAIPDMLREIVLREGGDFVRAGFTGFGDSALNFELLFDVISQEFEEIFMTRHRIGIAIVETFNERGYEFAYPTQTTFTAAPDGRFITPYAEIDPALVAKLSNP